MKKLLLVLVVLLSARSVIAQEAPQDEGRTLEQQLQEGIEMFGAVCAPIGASICVDHCLMKGKQSTGNMAVDLRANAFYCECEDLKEKRTS